MKLLACIGIVWILKDSRVFSIPREYLKSKANWLKELLSCSMCLGFWVGILLAYSDYLQTSKISIDYIYYPFAVSAFCWFFDCVLDLMQEAWFYFKTLRENIEKK